MIISQAPRNGNSPGHNCYIRMTRIDQNLALPDVKIQKDVILTSDGDVLRHLLRAGTRWLEAHINVVNGLNVFPVPDGDTGTNMCLTMQSALQEIEQLNDRDVGVIAAGAAHGALLGARGNSGVILAEFLQGIALGLEGKAVFTVEDFAYAAEVGVERAYQSVVNPVEGTILTVARAAATGARQGVEVTQDLTELLAHIVEAAKEAQASTPELLPVLKEAGVTDSGGQGLLYILEGALRFINREPTHLDPGGEVVPTLQSTLGVEKQAYGYDVQFLIQGDGLNVEKIRADIDNLGQSTVVVGDARTVKVHIHVDDPGIPLSYGAGLGLINDVVVENMQQQALAFVHEHALPSLQLSAKALSNIATISVVPGQGLIDIFHSLGADWVISGGQAMNPSTQELLEVVTQISVDHVLILPNNNNIILTAQQVKKMCTKHVEVIPTKTIPQGIAALISFNNQTDLETNVKRMVDAVAEIRTIELTKAVRRTTSNEFDIQVGNVIGFLDNDLLDVGQDYDLVTLNILAQIETSIYEIITIYYGQDSSYDQANILARKIKRSYPDLELEIHNGGQPHYYYIISVE